MMAVRYQSRVSSQEGFSRGAESYDDGVGRFTRFTADRMISKVGVVPGDRVLDLGTGPGVVVGAASRAGATCIGLDNARGMLSTAKSRHASALWVLGDGSALPFSNSWVDVVTSAYAFACIGPGGSLSTEVLRVLRPGGKLAFANWVPEGCSNVQILTTAIDRVGDPQAPRPSPHPGWLFPTLEGYRQIVSSPGLELGEAEIIEHTWSIATEYDLFDSLLRVNPRLHGHRPEYLTRIREESAKLASQYRCGSEIQLPMRIAYGFAVRRAQ